MEAYHTPTGYEGVPAPTKKLQRRQEIVYGLRTTITHLKFVLELAQAHEQKQVIPWLEQELVVHQQLLLLAEARLEAAR